MSGAIDSGLMERIAALGRDVTPQTIAATMEFFAPLHSRAAAEGVEVLRDRRYGTHERHRLDVFLPAAAAGEAPPRRVLVFVHGGGFVGGDKCSPGSPYYDNVGRWAAERGMIGVTVTYRLAPQFHWPAGSDDVAAAVNWVRENVAGHGGDPDAIFVMGQSAGAAHVAGYLAREHANTAQRHADSKNAWQPAAAILVSGLYDLATMERNLLFDAYFRSNGEIISEAAFLDALVTTSVPLMVIAATLDPSHFLKQALVLLNGYFARHGAFPRYWQAVGDNHLSTVLQLNTAHDRMGGALLDFISSIAPRKRAA